jgi:hypothetical protein
MRSHTIFVLDTTSTKVWSFASFKTMIELSTRDNGGFTRVSKIAPVQIKNVVKAMWMTSLTPSLAVVWWEWSRGSEQYYFQVSS